MELYQLRAFAAVAETGQLTRAAKRLHLSQPALSAQIKALEDELGQILFERTPGGMTLTAGGRDLQDYVARVLAATDTLKARAQALRHDVVAHLRIGTVSDPDFIRVGPLLNLAVARFPHLEIELHNVFSGAALEQVRSGALDASFYFGTLAHTNVKGLALREMVYRIAAPAAWAERIRHADWPAIAAMPWILTPPTSTHHALVEAILGEHGLSPTKQAEADNESVIANLVRAGVGLSLLREELALVMQEEGQVVVWAPARLATKLWFIYPSDRARDPAIAAVLTLLRELWRLPAEGSEATPPPGMPAATMP
jgi:molybdate transport repressor ModE-like protein